MLFDTYFNRPFYPAICGLLLLLTLSACFAPKAATGPGIYSGRYADYYVPEEVEISATYQHTVTQRGDRFVFRTFYPSTKQITHYREYQDEDRKVAVGPFKTWYDDGTINTVGQYEAGQAVGTWTYHHLNGEVREVGEFVSDERSGIWETFDNDGRLFKTSQYANGELDGLTVRYDSTGQVSREITYAAGELVSERLADGSDVLEDRRALREVERMPLFPGCEGIAEYDDRKKCADKAMLTHIYSHIRYPNHAREYSVEGMAVVSFVIEKDGSVSNINVIRGLDDDISAELIRLVGQLPRWEAGEQDGRKVRVQFNLPVRFKLT